VWHAIINTSGMMRCFNESKEGKAADPPLSARYWGFPVAARAMHTFSLNMSDLARPTLTRPLLRLVFPDAGPTLGQADARRAVEQETRAAAATTQAISQEDVRRLFAMQVSQSLEGGRAALLRPDSRRKLVNLATSAGLRPFDANLLIAIVQDSARRGEPTLSDPALASLHMVAPPATSAPMHWPGAPSRDWGLTQRDVLRGLALACCLAACAVVLLVRWLLAR
jgi:hypothetical protein